MPKKIFKINNTQCIAAGRGPELCFILGPGSFYLKNLILGSDIGEKYTFITCDEHWVNQPNQYVNNISINELLKFNHIIIQGIMTKFDQPKIGIVGFSAPACLSVKYADKYPQDVAWLQLIGASFENVDSSFSSSDQLFREKASSERVKKYEYDQSIRASIEHTVDNTGLYFSEEDYYTNSDNKKFLKANSAWVLETLSFYHKAFFNDTEKYRQTLIEHWESNLVSQHINPSFRNHFFQNLFPQIDSLSDLKKLEKSQIPIQIFSGEEDYITPVSQKAQNELNLIKTVNFIKYKKCGHYVYIENSEKFYLDFFNFTEATKS